jgi:hypothetical protein
MAIFLAQSTRTDGWRNAITQAQLIIKRFSIELQPWIAIEYLFDACNRLEVLWR